MRNLQLRLRLDAAIRQIAARFRARARRERRLEEFRRELDDVVQRLAALLARLGLRRRLRQRHARHGGEPLHRFGEVHPLGQHHEVEDVAVLAGGEIEPRRFWSFTKNDGVFSLLNGDSPFHSRPAFLSCTRRPTTSETGRRAAGRRGTRPETAW